MKNNAEVDNNVSAFRRRAGVSASELAQRVGVSRQTIYALEAGTYIPNTVVSLRLARVLGVKVEDLFTLTMEQARESRPAKVLPSLPGVEIGQPVQLCEVDGRLMAVRLTQAPPYISLGDATISGRGRVTVHDRELELGNRLLLAGCDPAMSVLASYLQPFGVEVVLLHQNSSASLALLKKGLIHIAGSHLRDESSGEANVTAVKRTLPGDAAAIVSFAVSEEGLLTRKDNPKGIRSVGDLAGKNVRLINRETGSGCRQLLDARLKSHNISVQSISGYGETAPGHLAAAAEVKAGRADCCVATRAAAQAYGLHFIPLESVRYDLVFRRQHLQLPAMQIVLDALNRRQFRQRLTTAGSYDTGLTGSRVM